MPPVSQPQRAAMGAAASGHSTLGIPKSVGQEFMNADPGGKLPVRAGLPVARPSSSVEALTGMSTGKKPMVRRGGGRHKTAPKATPQTHLNNLQSAMKAGNQQQAKLHALSLAKALHAAQGPRSTSQPAQAATPYDSDADGY